MGNICVSSQDDGIDYSSFSKNLEEFDSTFEVGQVLGFGEFSEVKSAKSASGEIAVKCIQLSKIRNQLHLLKREIGVMLKLKHPNIIQLLEVYENQDFVYLTMELCPDGNLKQRVKKFGSLSIDQVRPLTKKLLSALSFMHAKNICHRDIKPENILFKGQEPKLADFGLARLMAGTSNFSLVGTPYYLAPEVISGDYNMKCDVWSLGVVIYFAVTGKKPFEGKDRDELFERIQDDDIFWEGVEEGCQDFLRFVLNKNHRIRPSADDALEHKWLKE
jgi:calcium-dependent protein kinase